MAHRAAVLNTQNYDFLGITLSTLCGIHCLFTPLAILYFPSFGMYLESVWVHSLLTGLVVFTFYQSVFVHYKTHRSKVTLGTGLIGLFLLIIAYVLEVFAHPNETISIPGEKVHDESTTLYLAVTGAVLLITSHMLNIRSCRCFKKHNS